ncbi:hypothetical protein BC833DRAFT_586956 [Globomyces pollinis-pini]|nr:hypothetical protein BC833DRAFT_586956 [Globomyces pollinis-pini]
MSDWELGDSTNYGHVEEEQSVSSSDDGLIYRPESVQQIRNHNRDEVFENSAFLATVDLDYDSITPMVDCTITKDPSPDLLIPTKPTRKARLMSEKSMSAQDIFDYTSATPLNDDQANSIRATSLPTIKASRKKKDLVLDETVWEKPPSPRYSRIQQSESTEEIFNEYEGISKHYRGDRKTPLGFNAEAEIALRRLLAKYAANEIVIETKPIFKTKYVPERKARSYDHSRSKAPPLPPTPPSESSKLSQPFYQVISPSKLLKKLLLVCRSLPGSEPERPQSPDIQIDIPTKGAYYQEPFVANPLPVQLTQPPTPTDIHDDFLGSPEISETFKPNHTIMNNDEFLENSYTHNHPSLLYMPSIHNPNFTNQFRSTSTTPKPLMNTHKLQIDVSIGKEMYNNTLFSAPARMVQSSDSPGNLFFYNHNQTSTKLKNVDLNRSKTISSSNNLIMKSTTRSLSSHSPKGTTSDVKESSKLLTLPALKLHSGNPLMGELSGVNFHKSKINDEQNNFRRIFHKYNSEKANNTNNTKKLPNVVHLPKIKTQQHIIAKA